MRHEVEDSF